MMLLYLVSIAAARRTLDICSPAFLTDESTGWTQSRRMAPAITGGKGAREVLVDVRRSVQRQMELDYNHCESMLLSTRSMGALRAAWELQDARKNRSEVIVAARAVRWMTCKWNWGCEMGPLHEEARWLGDGDGMRCYFSEGDRRGPSRLECYRRLLAKPVDMKRGGYRSLDPLLACAALQRFAAVLELGRKTWRDWSAIHLIWGRNAADRRPRAGDAPFELDDEFNAAVAEAPLAARFTSDFESDLSRPLRLSLDEWPQRSPLERAREKFWSMLGEAFKPSASAGSAAAPGSGRS